MPDGVLKPEQSTKPTTLRFHLKDARLPPVDPQNGWKSLRPSLIELDLDVLGEPPAVAPEVKK
jgi:hypothetical protein